MAKLVFADRETQVDASVTNGEWSTLSEAAWNARKNARLVSGVQVGAAALTQSGKLFVGCNVEHKFRCHDIHAEVNALSSMMAGGEKQVKAVLVAAESSKFTPCGGCLDWIMELGGESCLVAYQNLESGPIHVFTATQLMPHYPAL